MAMSTSPFVHNKPVDDWSEEDVQTFLTKNQAKYHLNDASVKFIVEQEFTGKGLLMLTEDKLVGYGMKRGPACTVVCLITDLKLAKGLKPPTPFKRKRWEALNFILDAHKRAKTTAEGASSTVYSSVSWQSIKSVYDPITRKMSIKPKEVPAEDLESLHKYLCRVGSLLGPLQSGKEAKRLHFIAPILIYLGGLFDKQMIILIEECVPGINIHTNGNFEFVIQVGGKKICIVEAKKENIQQGMAQNLLGCEAVADAELSPCVLGIVTNFIQWVFYRSLQDHIEQENITMQIDEEKPTRGSLKLIAEKIYSLLSDDG